MADIITVENLYKSFGTTIKTEVLKGISIKFVEGAFTAIIGSSGSGKTTFLNIISLLESPTSGKLTIGEQEFSDGNINKYASYRNNNIGFIFQFHYLLPEFNSLENILMPYWIGNGKPDKKIVDKALKIMKLIGIENIKHKYPNQVSGGQQQRIAIARSIIKDPKIIFADEPTGNLDHESGEAVMSVLKKMVKEIDTTLIMVTHDRDIALNADRIVELSDGKICKAFTVSKKNVSDVKKLLSDRSCFMIEKK